MPRTMKRSTYTMSEQTYAEIAALANLWGGVATLPDSQVIREAVHRAYMTEIKPPNGRQKKSGKKSQES